MRVHRTSTALRGAVVCFWVTVATLSVGLSMAAPAAANLLAYSQGMPVTVANECAYQINGWGADSGLPDNRVLSIVQTPDGYLWVGTLNGGVARFDGKRFVNFHPGNTPALKSFNVRKLLVDPAGTLWAGTVDGMLFSYRDGVFHPELRNTEIPLSALDRIVSFRPNEIIFASEFGWLIRGSRSGADYRWEIFRPPDEHRSASPCADSDGVIWYRTKNGKLGGFKNNQFFRVEDPPGLRSQEIRTLATDAKGRLWVGTGKELAVWDGKTFVTMTPTNGESELAVQQIAPTSDGAIWVRTMDRLRKCVDRRWVATAEPWSGQFSPVVMYDVKLIADAQGGVWVGHYGDGLWHVDQEGRVARVGEKEGLPSGLVESLYEDHEGNVWVGLAGGGGLVCLHPRIFHTVWPTEDLQRYRATRSITEDSEGTLWLGTAGSSFLRWRNDELTPFFPAPISSAGVETTVYPDRAGRLWVNVFQRGVMALESGEARQMFPNSTLGGMARVLCIDRAGTLWIGNDFGLFRVENGKLQRFTAADGFSPAHVVAITEDRAGNLWIGTALGELRQFRDGRFETFLPKDSPTTEAMIKAAALADQSQFRTRGALVASERFWALYADADGVIWIGTLGGGLLRFEGGKFTRFTIRDGLPSEHVSQILEDERGQLWLGTRRGIARVDRAALNEFARGTRSTVPFFTYGKSDGLPTLECSEGSQPACWRSRDGRLWFATIKGAVWVNPLAVPHNARPPPVVVEEVLVDGRPLVAEGAPPILRVPAGQHYLEFKFTALSLTAPDKVRFKWRLLGLDHDWKSGGEARAVSYPFIPPGEYQFEVQACNNDGVWNEAGAAVAVTVLPFFWQTWWFKLVSVTMVGFLLLGAVLSAQRRRYRAQMQVLERQHTLEKERTRIARDIHDQVGANLTKIGRLGEFLDRHSAVIDPHKPVLQTMADTTSEIVRTMDEIVWAVNPRNDTLENLVNYLVHYSEEFLGSSGVACTLDLPPVFASRPVSAEVRHNLFMAVKEALNNSVKHGHPTRVNVRLAVTDDEFTVCLEDDGSGFDPTSPVAGRNGLENMRIRLESVGGWFEVASGPGRGTSTQMSVPVREA